MQSDMNPSQLQPSHYSYMLCVQYTQLLKQSGLTLSTTGAEMNMRICARIVRPSRKTWVYLIPAGPNIGSRKWRRYYSSVCGTLRGSIGIGCNGVSCTVARPSGIDAIVVAVAVRL